MKKIMALVLLQSCAALNALYTGKDNIKIPDSIEGLREYQQKNPWLRQKSPERLFFPERLVEHKASTTDPKLGGGYETWAPARSAEDVLQKLVAHRSRLFNTYPELQSNPGLIQGLYDALKAEYADKDKRYFENKTRDFFHVDHTRHFLSDDMRKPLFTRDKVQTLDELLLALAEVRRSIIEAYAAAQKDQTKVKWQELYRVLANDDETKNWIEGLIKEAQSKLKAA
jgi:hypothetical protein